MNGPAWRASLRMARRDVRRAKGRSALVALMVGLPVAATVGLTTLIATGSTSAVEALPATLGTTQAEVTPQGRAPIDQDPEATQFGPRSSDSTLATQDGPAWSAAEIRRLTGGRLLTERLGTTLRNDGTRNYATPVRELDLTDPATRGMVVVLAGRVPSATGEVDVSPALARAGIGVGDRVALDQGAVSATVVGIARDRYASDAPEIQAWPGSVLDPAESETHFLLARRTPVSWSDVRRLNQVGLLVLSRQVVEHPPAQSEVPAAYRNQGDSSSGSLRAVLAIAIVAIVIEVILLAGPAFAVGVGRQRRQLALVAATGGEPRDVRRVVLAQGVVLGLGASLVGVGAGLVGSDLVARLLVRRYAMGPFDVVWWQLLAAFAIGAGAAVSAAWMPARQAARHDVVAVLAGRRGALRGRRGLPVLGVVLAVGGTVGTVVLGTRPGGETIAAFGTVVVVLGMVALMPGLLGLVGRSAGRLPLPLRLAARDASRQRGRTAPAVAAVMGAVAGITAIALGSSSDFAQARRDYQPQYARGATVLTPYGLDATQWSSLGAAVARTFPGHTVLPYADVDVPYDAKGNPVSTEPSVVAVVQPGCAAPRIGGSSDATDESCFAVGTYNRPTTIASSAAVRLLGQPLTETQAAALDHGAVLVGDPRLLGSDGRLHLDLLATASGTNRVTAVRRLPALTAVSLRTSAPSPQSNPGTAIFASPRTAERLHLPTVREGGIVAGSTLTPADEARLKDLVPAADPDQSVYTERGFQQTYAVPLIALGLAGLLTVLVGTLTATGLALAESRPDLATLAAVGARPRTRRVLAATQALLIGLLGAVTGVLVGFVPGWAVSRPLTAGSGGGPVLVVPWLLLAAIAVGVPLLAAFGSLVLTRSRLPLTRRLG